MTYLFSYRRVSGEIIQIISKLPNYKPVQQAPEQILDIQINFIDKAIQIEKKMRHLIETYDVPREMRVQPVRQMSRLLRERSLISEVLLAAIDSICKIRNVAIHGIDVPEDDLRNALELANYVLLELNRIQRN